MQLDRQDLIDGLREVVRAAHEKGITGVSIRIVGGAALRLAYFDRDTTADIDAQIEPMDRLEPIIEGIARDRGWRSDWLNNKAVMFIPPGARRSSGSRSWTTRMCRSRSLPLMHYSR